MDIDQANSEQKSLGCLVTRWRQLEEISCPKALSVTSRLFISAPSVRRYTVCVGIVVVAGGD
jgi:hypothetical protein